MATVDQTPFNTRAEIILWFGDGRYLFSLKVPQLEELERICKASIFKIVHRMIGMDASITEIRETIRLGLVGGGMAPIRAEQMRDLYGGPPNQPLDNPTDSASPYKVAKAVLLATMVGIDELSSGDNSGPKKSQEEATGPTSERPSSSSISASVTLMP